jgi:arabinofuranosyltransferase
VSGAKVVLDDIQYPGFNGHQVAELYAKGQRGYYRVLSVDPLPGADPDQFVFTLGSIGVPAYDAGRRVWVIDIGGLAEPLAARTGVVPDRPAGHRKQVDPAWYDARFAAPGPNDTVQVIAARHVLADCRPVSDLMEAVNGDLTVGRFLSNIWHSVEFTRLDIPADPIQAERQFCQ